MSNSVHIRFVIGLLLAVISIIGAVGYTSFIQHNVTDNFILYFSVGVIVTTVYAIFLKHVIWRSSWRAQAKGITADGGQVFADFMVFFFVLFFVCFGVSVVVQMAGFNDVFLSREFGERLLPSSTFEAAYVVPAGGSVEMRAKSKQCFLGGNFAQQGNGTAIILSRPGDQRKFGPTYPGVGDSFEAAWQKENANWGMTIQSWRNVTCDYRALAGNVSFPRNINSVLRLTLQLKMPTFFPKGNSYHQFSNVTEDLVTEPFDVVLLPAMSDAQQQYTVRTRVKDLAIKIGFVTLGACLFSWSIMYYLWKEPF